MPRPTFPCEPDVLPRVTVRLLEDHERDRFNLLIEELHYLHSSVFVGEHMRYVAELDGQWVALLTFTAASLHLKGRDKRIGWSPRQCARRLSFVANNSRFLVLTDRHPALQPLPEALALPPGVLVTADAMHCQQQSARYITQELDGDYLFGLKGNQEGAEKKAEALLSQRFFPLGEQRPMGKAS